jgi:hypothetical protein
LENNIKTHIYELSWEDLGWIGLVYDRELWRAVGNIVLDIGLNIKLKIGLNIGLNVSLNIGLNLGLNKESNI